jgi:molecular chaperone HscA
VRAALRDDGELCTPEVAAAMEAAIITLERAMSGEDHRAIHDAAVALDEAGRPFAEARMQRSIDRAVRGRRVEELEA